MTASRTRVLCLLGTLALMSLVFILSSHALPPMPINFTGIDKIEHLTVYGVLGILILRSMRHGESGYSAAQIAAAVAIASAYGISDEVHQYFVPGRTADVLDWCADTAGALAATLVAAAWIRHTSTKPVSGTT